LLWCILCFDWWFVVMCCLLHVYRFYWSALFLRYKMRLAENWSSCSWNVSLIWFCSVVVFVASVNSNKTVHMHRSFFFSIFLLDFTVFSFFFSSQCVVGLLIINTVIIYGPPAWWTFSFSGDLPLYILCDYYECFDLWQINWWWWWWWWTVLCFSSSYCYFFSCL